MKTNPLKFIKNPIVVITLVYLLSQFFMLIMSGCWWDDLTFETHNIEYINAVATQSGRPEWKLLIPFCWSLFNNGRILIFILYYLISLFVFIACKESTFFSKEQSLIITLLFISIPVNDARLLISNFSYTVGLFLFYFAFMIFIKWNSNHTIKKTIILRIILLILFYCSFILNSLLAFYYVLFIYLFVLEFKKHNDFNVREVFISAKNVVTQYLDFFILPFAYFCLNKILFPTSDTFANYNSVTIEGLYKSTKYLPLSIIGVFKSLFTKNNQFDSFFLLFAITSFILAVIYLIKNKKENLKNNMYIFAIGLIILCLGLFPYVVVRKSIISCTGVNGRDAVLVQLGVSLIIYSFINNFKNKIKIALTLFVVIFGIITYNLLYIEWQKDFYYQKAMENYFCNETIEENDTFYLIDLNESSIKGQRFYSLNVNAYHVYNNETRLFIPKVSDLYILESKDNIDMAKNAMVDAHFMKDYNPQDYCLDAVIVYSCDLTAKNTIVLKYYELFENEAFEEIINSIGKMQIVTVDNDFTEILLKEYKNGMVKDDYDVLNCLQEYKRKSF